MNIRYAVNLFFDYICDCELYVEVDGEIVPFENIIFHETDKNGLILTNLSEKR